MMNGKMLLRFGNRCIRTRQLSSVGGFTYPAPRKLDDVVKLDLLRRESKERVEEIWLGYHAEKEFNVAEMWTAEQFKAFKQAAAKFGKLFFFPVPRDGGHFNVISQVQGAHVLFTYLEDYKRDPHGAQPYLAVTFYEELAKDQGLVLVRGDIAPLALDREESLKLLALTRQYYLEETESVAAFNKGKLDFDAHIKKLLSS